MNGVNGGPTGAFIRLINVARNKALNAKHSNLESCH